MMDEEEIVRLLTLDGREFERVISPPQDLLAGRRITSYPNLSSRSTVTQKGPLNGRPD